MADGEVYDETTVGFQTACMADCAVFECPPECPCGCEDCDGDPGGASTPSTPEG